MAAEPTLASSSTRSEPTELGVNPIGDGKSDVGPWQAGSTRCTIF